MLVLKNDKERDEFLESFDSWPLILSDSSLGIEIREYLLDSDYSITATTYMSQYGRGGRSSPLFKMIHPKSKDYYNSHFESPSRIRDRIKQVVPNKVPKGYCQIVLGKFLYERSNGE